MVTGQRCMTVKTTNKPQIESHQELSVQVSLTGLSFLIKDLQKNEFVFFEAISFSHPLPLEALPEEIDKVYQKFHKLQQAFSKIVVIHHNKLFALVPEALFDKENSVHYLNHTAKTLTTDYIDFDTLDLGDMVNVYVPFTNVNNYLFEKYGSFTFQHHNTVFVNSILAQSTMDDAVKMYVHCLGSTVDILVVKNKKVQLCNTFECSTPEDFIYYLLFVAEQLQLNPEEFELYLTGNISKEHAFYEIAYRYVRNVSFLRPTQTTTTAEDITENLYNTHYLLTHC